jgi:uncharacterized GH25 family protein
LSNPQIVATVVVFDYLIGTAGRALTNQDVSCTLTTNNAINSSPRVSLGQLQQVTTTDQNGYYQFTFVPNVNMTTTTKYEISTPQNVWEISIPIGAGPFQVGSILA